MRTRNGRGGLGRAGAALGLAVALGMVLGEARLSGQPVQTMVVHGDVIVPQVRRRPWAPQETRLEKAIVRVDVRDQIATTSLRLVVRNPSNAPREAQIVLPVPEGVAVRSLQYDGTGPEPVAQLLPREEARRIYDSIVSSMRDPALVEFVGFNLIKTSVFPVPAGSEMGVTLTFEQRLESSGTRVDYWLPRSEALGTGGVEWTIEADIRDAGGVASVYSPSHELTTTRVSPEHVRVVAREVTLPDGSRADRTSVRLSYLRNDAPQGAMTASVIAYPDPTLSATGGGYFLLVCSPNASEAVLPKAKREVVLVIDRSGSMRGEKLEQVKEAARQVLAGLRDGEYFNIIDYSDSIESFAKEPVEVDAGVRTRGGQYIDTLAAGGGTNIQDALLEALRPEPRAEMPIVLFLTDGLATIGERSETKIRDRVGAGNTHKRRIFTFGVGYDLNSALLSTIARATRASSSFVRPGDDVEVAVSQVYERLGGPVLGEPTIVTKGEGATRLSELQPSRMPDVFKGDQVVVMGQYRGHEPVQVRIEGKLAGGGAHAYDVGFDPKAASSRNGYVARLWASAKIASLLEAIRDAKAEATVPPERMRELTDEIVRLSTRFGVLTEYTAFLATEPGMGGGLPAAREAVGATLGRRMSVRDGAASVNQEANIEKLSAKSLPATANAQQWYLDSRMEVKRVDSVQNVAQRALYKRGTRWVESDLLAKDEGEPEETIEFGTPRYAELVARLVASNEQALLALDEDLMLNFEGKRVLVLAPRRE